MAQIPSVLPLVLAHIRAGALGQAWRLFREGGLEGERADPAVLAVRGRLLKEEALGAEGAARADLQRQAAEAYAAAGALSGATYHLINAASLWRLAGDAAAAAEGARGVLERLERHPEEAETPYWRSATRAEALLLLGRPDDARAALAEAIADAPQAWEDHAVTLRQFAMICAAQGGDAAWLDALRPPRAVHFAGHMSLGAGEAALGRKVRAALDAERAGFGFGALAAGADIVVAEALLERGAELRLVLPAAPPVFREASVARQGDGWAARYDAVLAAAATVQAASEGDRAPHMLAVQLAAEMAMGEAALHARALQTEAIQLLVLDLDERGGEPGGAGWAGELWAASGRRQIVAQSPRQGRAPRPVPPPGPAERLMAMLSMDVDGDRLGGVAAALAGAVPAAVNWAGRTLHLAFDRPAAAAKAAGAVRRAAGLEARVAGHYGLVDAFSFPGASGPLVAGAAARLPEAILEGTPPGACHVTGPLAAAACAADPSFRAEPVGELDLGGAREALPLLALRS